MKRKSKGNVNAIVKKSAILSTAAAMLLTTACGSKAIETTESEEPDVNFDSAKMEILTESSSTSQEVLRLDSEASSDQPGEFTLTDSELAQLMSNVEQEKSANLQAYVALVAKNPSTRFLIPTNTNESLKITVGKGSKTRTFALHNADSIKQALGYSARLEADVDNQMKFYKKLYSSMPQNVQGLSVSPSAIRKNVAAINSAISNMMQYAVTNGVLPALASKSSDASKLQVHACEKEYGFDFGSDIGKTDPTSTTTSFNANGIMQNISFPLRNKMSCVKDQGSRGTCSSFAITAGFETYFTKKYVGQFVNLSEQNVNWYEEVKVYPDGEEGANTSGLLTHMEKYGYSPQSEMLWNYNPGLERTASFDYWATDFSGVCKGYSTGAPTYKAWGEMCTETSHEGETETVTSGDMSATVFRTPSVGITGYTAEDVTSVWSSNASTVKASLQVLLITGTPVVFSFSVPNYFSNNSFATGYVPYSASKEGCTEGGHAILLIGWVDNETLSKSIPSAKSGSGGGYFIAKNSWGTNNGDDGYYYLPADFVTTYGTGAVVFEPGGSLK